MTSSGGQKRHAFFINVKEEEKYEEGMKGGGGRWQLYGWLYKRTKRESYCYERLKYCRCLNKRKVLYLILALNILVWRTELAFFAHVDSISLAHLDLRLYIYERCVPLLDFSKILDGASTMGFLLIRA